jgi:hypothetical protein
MPTACHRSLAICSRGSAEGSLSGERHIGLLAAPVDDAHAGGDDGEPPGLLAEFRPRVLLPVGDLGSLERLVLDSTRSRRGTSIAVASLIAMPKPLRRVQVPSPKTSTRHPSDLTLRRRPNAVLVGLALARLMAALAAAVQVKVRIAAVRSSWTSPR